MDKYYSFFLIIVEDYPPIERVRLVSDMPFKMQNLAKQGRIRVDTEKKAFIEAHRSVERDKVIVYIIPPLTKGRHHAKGTKREP